LTGATRDRLAPFAAALCTALAAPPATSGWAALLLSVLAVGFWTLGLHGATSDRGAFMAGGVAVGGASLFILHWTPMAAAPYLGLWGGVLGWLAIVGLHGVVGGAVGLVVRRLRHTVPKPLLMGAAWGMVDWAPGAIPWVGIPWPSLAWALLDTPLLAGTAVFGASGFGVLAAMAWSGLPSSPSMGGRIFWAVGPLLLWAGAPLLLPAVDPSASRDHAHLESAASVPAPGEGAHAERATITWDRDRALLGDDAAIRASVSAFLENIAPALPEGVPSLWPEAPLVSLLGQDPDVLSYLQTVQQAGENTSGAGAVAGVHALVGGRRFNTLVRTGGRDEAPVGVHRKRYLVPGIERTHLSGAGRPAVDRRPGRGLAPGAGALPFPWGDRDVGALLCFEILHPGEAARLRRRGATLLLQATHDAMLSSAGRRQHEAMVRVRAAEFRLPILRAALGGEGMAVGADGRRLDPIRSTPVLDGVGRSLGRVDTFVLPQAPDSPPSAWVVPLTGPLALAILLFPMAAEWRRRRWLRGFTPS